MNEWKFGQESGSGKETKIVLITRVMKEASDERTKKLVDEINFLENLPKKWKGHFPEIIFAKKEGKRAYYEMPHYPYPTLRKLIFTEVFDASMVLQWLDKILEFYMSMVSTGKINIPRKYMCSIHQQRLQRRLAELSRKSSIFKALNEQTTLKFNNVEYENIPVIFEKIRNSGFLNKCKPPFVSPWTHSDMHFSNIMIDLEYGNFMLLDPRGYKVCDYYYDFGKLWHSVNGKYELIAERKFTLEDNILKLEHGKPYAILEEVKKQLPSLLTKYSLENEEITMMKTEFNEAMHFASLVPFILDYDKTEKRALAAYYTATELLNKFYSKWM